MAMGDRRTILVVDDDEDILRLLWVMLLNEGHSVVAATSAEEALRLIETQKPDLAILDVMLPRMDGYALCRQLRKNPATRLIPILMLTAKGEVADKIAGFRAGADDYVVKPIEKEELRYRIRNLLTRGTGGTQEEAEKLPRGHVLVVYGLKGGVGKTTLAVNFAIALSRCSGGRVALYDADFSFGETAMHLSLPPVHSIADLARDVHTLDAEMVTQVLSSHDSGLRVLLSPFRPEQADLITPEHAETILDLLATSYNYVVVDCFSSYDERNLTLLGHADAVLLVVTPEIGSLKNTDLFLDMADQLGISKEKIYIILNRANSNVGINPAEIERVFKRPLSLQIPSGGRAVPLSANRGQPLVLDQPNHPVAQQCVKMAEFFAKQWKTV